MVAPIERAFAEDQARVDQRQATELLASLIQSTQYVGEVYSLGYETALVQIHDRYRKDVGGIPGLCFLAATRLLPGQPIDFTKEDTSVILLRVMDEASLPNAPDAERARADAAQRVSGEDKLHWDSPEVMDSTTAHLLSFAGMRCRVIGTFYVDKPPKDRSDLTNLGLLLRFGSDISNFYPNQGLKVYKPNGEALRRIINYRDLLRVDPLAAPVVVGEVRYASTNRSYQGISSVPVEIVPEDLLGQKTALFGMTRIGKSNTTKVIVKSVFELRFKNPKRQRVGQVIFDPNGEYANENVQDAQGANPNAIKNVWRSFPDGLAEDVITFGSRPHPNDPNRRLMLVNFFEWDNLQIGKTIIDSALADEPQQYIDHFRQASLTPPEDYNQDWGSKSRFNRRVLAYRSLLATAGYAVPPGMIAKTDGLFNKDLLAAMRDPKANEKADRAADYIQAAAVLASDSPSWDALASAFEALYTFIRDRKSGYQTFNNDYISKSGENWADSMLLRVLGAFAYPGGAKLIARAIPMHTTSSKGDYAAAIYKALVSGKLVIVDQSGGDELVNRASATRVMDFIFRQNREAFRAGKQPPEILIFVEEAHNILPSGSETNTQDTWVRTAKEGAKYHLGLVYATQEVSGIQRNILRNTSNWFIGHLNNTDETKELIKYYDFADFERSILRAQDRGFIRVKTLSNLYVVPAQINAFRVGA